MPGIKFERLAEHFVGDIEREGATVLEVGRRDQRPARVRVISPEVSIECLLFLWTITPGGGGAGVRPANERRIQITGVERFALVPGVRTIVGGWSEEFGAYAFWDPRRHSVFSTRSPSFQVDARTLETAAHHGVATYHRPALEGAEIVVAVARDMLLWYVQTGHLLHGLGADATNVSQLIDASPEDERSLIDSSESDSQAARRVDLVEIMRRYRDARFKPQVLRAYSYRCAVCGYALKLADAAHIVPVSHPRGTDHVNNGLALCRLHHAAYDNGLLGVQSSYRIVLNPAATKRLKEMRLDAGLVDFQERIPESITPPPVIEVRPAPDNLRLGLEVRGWPRRLVV